jgi:hypothetical protein
MKKEIKEFLSQNGKKSWESKVKKGKGLKHMKNMSKKGVEARRKKKLSYTHPSLDISNG